MLRYVRERLGVDTHFDVITGTSVGAINGAYIAATCDRPKAQARTLQRVWSSLTIDKVYDFNALGREAALDIARGEARDRAIEAGADPSTIDIVHVEEIPLAYLPGAVRVNVKAVGDLLVTKAQRMKGAAAE